MLAITKLLVFIFVGKVLLETLDPHEIILLSIWLWATLGFMYHLAIRKNGMDMLKAGRRRALRAHW